MADHLFVVTGGPGSGKTSLVDALAAGGLSTTPEAGRAVIRNQRAIGGSALPWADRTAFAEKMLAHDLKAHHAASLRPGPTICDRGVPDVLGYLMLCGLPVPRDVQQAAERIRYNRTVFLAPHWPEIYANDAERKQSAAEAAETGSVLERTYAALGYDLVPLPLVPVADRAAFVRARIGAYLPRNG